MTGGVQDVGLDHTPIVWFAQQAFVWLHNVCLNLFCMLSNI
jgi:hypothetical protein